VENLDLSNTVVGVYLWGTNNTMISGNNVAGTWNSAIILHMSSNNSIVGNHIADNTWIGILLYSSSHNLLTGNRITENWYGIWLNMSSNNTFRSNNLIDNRFNFYLRDLNFKAWGPMHFVNDVDVSNTVNGKPIYYWVKKQDAIVPSDAGYVVLVNCTNITVKNLSLEDNGQGMLLAFTENSAIRQNNIANNRGGIWLYKSSSNSVVGNNITTNWYGIALFASSNNRVYHNNLKDNGVWDQAWDDPDIPPSLNVWDDGYPSCGNYWSDYAIRYPNAQELDDSGIWDTIRHR